MSALAVAQRPPHRPARVLDPDTVRAIADLRDREGLSQRAIAKRLGLSQWLVRTRYAPIGNSSIPRRPAPKGQCSWPGCGSSTTLGWRVCDFHRKRALGLIE